MTGEGLEYPLETDDPDVHLTEIEQLELYILQRDLGYTYQQYMHDPEFVPRNLLNHLQREREARRGDEDGDVPASRRTASDWEKGSGLDQI